MANNIAPQTTAAEARAQLDALNSDQNKLATRTRFPFAASLGLGLIAAAYVATPALPATQVRNVASAVGLAIIIWLLDRHAKATGVKGQRLSARQWVIYGACLALSLLLLSVSFALVSLDLSWWVIAVSLVALVSITALAEFSQRG